MTDLNTVLRSMKENHIVEAAALLPSVAQARAKNVLNRATRNMLIRNTALREGLTENNARLVLEGLDYKPAADVEAKLDNAIGWVRDKVAGRPYALLICEPPALDVTKSHLQIKSDVWLATRVAAGIGRWPARFITLSTRDFKPPTKSLSAAYRAGVRDFVAFDDASYSGAQLIEYFSTINSWRAKRTDVRLHVACAYASPYARKVIAAELRPGNDFYSPGTMRMLDTFIEGLPANRRNAISRFLLATRNIDLNLYDKTGKMKS